MKAKIVLGIEVEHDGNLSSEELAATLGVWVENLPLEFRHIATMTADDVNADVVVLRASAAVDVTSRVKG